MEATTTTSIWEPLEGFQGVRRDNGDPDEVFCDFCSFIQPAEVSREREKEMQEAHDVLLKAYLIIKQEKIKQRISEGLEPEDDPFGDEDDPYELPQYRSQLVYDNGPYEMFCCNTCSMSMDDDDRYMVSQLTFYYLMAFIIFLFTRIMDGIGKRILPSFPNEP